jgi:hypothetical protein
MPAPISGTRSSLSPPAVPQTPLRHPIQSKGRLSAAVPPTSGGIPRRWERGPPGGHPCDGGQPRDDGPEPLCDGGRCATDGWNREGAERSLGSCWTARSKRERWPRSDSGSPPWAVVKNA